MIEKFINQNTIYRLIDGRDFLLVKALPCQETYIYIISISGKVIWLPRKLLPAELIMLADLVG